MSRNVRAVIGIAIVVALGWLVTPSAIPLYDGQGFPDEAYRYVSPPPGSKTTPPVTTLLKPMPVQGGGNTSQFITSGEQGPQITLRLGAKAFLADGAKTITVRGTPTAPKDQPTFGEIEGNVYVVSATSDGGSVRRGTAFADIILREVILAPVVDPIVAYRAKTGDPWQQLKTTRWGADIFEAPLGATGVGEYVVVNPAHGGSGGAAAQKGGGNASLLIIGGAALVAVIAGILLALRVRSLRAASTRRVPVKTRPSTSGRPKTRPASKQRR
jgi:hypothetical protein